MAARIEWTDKAEQQLDTALNRCRAKFGFRIAADFYRQVKRHSSLLADNPCLGAKEPLLEMDYDPLTYRSLVVHKLYKIIYYVEADVVHVVKFWDTRSNPVNMPDNLR